MAECKHQWVLVKQIPLPSKGKVMKLYTCGVCGQEDTKEE